MARTSSTGRYGEFRVVDWNTASWAKNVGNEAAIVLTVLAKVELINANVITLQEVTPKLASDLPAALGSGWHCRFARVGVAGLTTCVRGTIRNYRWQRLAGVRWGPHKDHWAYMQLDYNGVTITNVHTRAFWADNHRLQLQREILAGIVVGDFNHTAPGFHQTDVDLEPTFKNRKIDHALTVQAPLRAWGDAQTQAAHQTPQPSTRSRTAATARCSIFSSTTTPSRVGRRSVQTAPDSRSA
ncbi:MAG: endonuclease/exonuclease/phosphatase family protein [Nannocystaceae bacterium]|nr:endonuclease/exonuclease/phosphatase family protein [Nannocystaceae bacterium]